MAHEFQSFEHLQFLSNVINAYLRHIQSTFTPMKSQQLTLKLACASLFFLLVACSVNLEFEIFSSDLIDVAEKGGQPLFVNANVRMDHSEEEEEEIKNFMKENFRDAENFRVVEEEYSSYLLADYKLPIVNIDDDSFKEKGDLLTIVVQSSQDSSFEIGVRFNREQFDQMNVFAQEKFYSDISLGDSKMKFDFRSDNSEMLDLEWTCVYVDGRPVPLGRSFKMEKRDKLEIEFSKIFKEAMKSSEEVLFFGKLSVLN
jgi:hypothetical protein